MMENHMVVSYSWWSQLHGYSMVDVGFGFIDGLGYRFAYDDVGSYEYPLNLETRGARRLIFRTGHHSHH